MSDDEFQTPPGFPFHPLQVLSDKQLAALKGTSVDTVQRRRAKGDAPPRIQLSERRQGTLASTSRSCSRASARGQPRDEHI